MFSCGCRIQTYTNHTHNTCVTYIVFIWSFSTFSKLCLHCIFNELDMMKSDDIFISLFSGVPCVHDVWCEFDAIFETKPNQTEPNREKLTKRIFSITTFSDFDEFLINSNRHVLPKLKQKYIPPKCRRAVRDSKKGSNNNRKIPKRKRKLKKMQFTAVSRKANSPFSNTHRDRCAKTHFKWFNYMRAAAVCVCPTSFVSRKDLLRAADVYFCQSIQQLTTNFGTISIEQNGNVHKKLHKVTKLLSIDAYTHSPQWLLWSTPSFQCCSFFG